MRTLLAVMVAGALGAAARYGADGVVSSRLGGQLPWGTFVVNVSGCFLLGILYTLLTGRFTVDPGLRIAITVGFVGSYTTFSTLILETAQLGQGGSYVLAALNAFGSLVAGMVALAAGIVMARLT